MVGFSELSSNTNGESVDQVKNLEKTDKVDKFEDDFDESLAKILEETNENVESEDNFDELLAKIIEETDANQETESDFSESLAKILEYIDDDEFESNTTYILDREKYDSDDNGQIFKIDEKPLSEMNFQRNNFEYKTDEQNRIYFWEGKPQYNPQNERDLNAQKESGGEKRIEGDEGGHLVARIQNGSPGSENIVPMRDTINRGDYKKSENEITEALKAGKYVYDTGRVIYENDSPRPSNIIRKYIIDKNTNILKMDNIKGSVDLLNDLEVNSADKDGLLKEIDDMKQAGNEVSVTSILNRYDKDNNLVSQTVGIRNETTGKKVYRDFTI